MAESVGRFLVWSRRRRDVPLAAATAYSVFLQLLASLPAPNARQTGDAFLDSAAQLGAPVDWRDFGHLGVYGLVGVLWLWALNSRRPRTPSSLYLALIIAPLLGILTEVSQIPMATRVFSLRDLGANVIAALIGVVLTTRLIRSIENVSANPSLQRTR